MVVHQGVCLWKSMALKTKHWNETHGSLNAHDFIFFYFAQNCFDISSFKHNEIISVAGYKWRSAPDICVELI